MVFGTSLIRTIRVYDRPFHGFLMICQKRAKMQPATLGMFTDKYLVLSYMVGTQIPPPPRIKRPEKCYAFMLGMRKRARGGSEERKSPGGHLGIFWVGMCRPGLLIGTPF